MLEQCIATVATILAGAILVPQIVRLIRHRRTAGVAVTWAVLGLITNVAWVVYLGMVDLWIAALAPGMAVVTYAMVVRLVALDVPRSWLIVAAGYSAALGAIGLVGGIEHLGAALALVPAIQLTPQIVSVHREPCPTGVSPLTWTFSIAEAVLWTIYGLRVGDLALVWYGLVTSTGSALILGLWWTSVPHRWSPAWSPALSSQTQTDVRAPMAPAVIEAVAEG